MMTQLELEKKITGLEKISSDLLKIFTKALADSTIENLPSGVPSQAGDRSPASRLVASVWQTVYVTPPANALLNTITTPGAGTYTVQPNTWYWVNIGGIAVFNFPDGATIARGTKVRFVITSGASGGHVFNAFSGGYFRNDNQIYTAFNPIYPPGTFSGQLVLEFEYLNVNVWSYGLPMPFTGSLNATPYLGEFKETYEDGVIAEKGNIYDINPEGHLTMNGVVIKPKGQFKNPRGA